MKIRMLSDQTAEQNAALANACQLAAELDNMGEMFPDVLACLKAGQDLARLTRSMQIKIDWYTR